jgi:PleD family two-component response regulator
MMSTKPKFLQKFDVAQASYRKFIEKIKVKNKKRPKKNPQKRINRASDKRKVSSQKLNQEFKANLSVVRQQKTKLEELTKATIEELKKLHSLHKKKTKSQQKGKENKTSGSQNKNNHGFELDYELTNLKMIKKILALSIPVEATQHALPKKAKPIKQSASSKGKKKKETKGKEICDVTKVLIIEDDQTTINIIKHILELHDFNVRFALDAEDGLKMVFKDKPGLILLDIMLPGMDGFQLLTKLQSTEETSQIPVIILSSLSGEKDILKGLEKGAVDYILKPFSPQILFFKIKKIMSLKNERFALNRHV